MYVQQLTETGTPASAGLLLQFLSWIDDRPRDYAETMDAWRTSCPRLPVWEDAFSAGLVRLVRGPSGTQSATQVVLTATGSALLHAAGC